MPLGFPLDWKSIVGELVIELRGTFPSCTVSRRLPRACTMSQAFPCPNPTCTHIFIADAIQGSAQLVCPRCRTVFQFQPTAAPPPVPSRPAPSPSALPETVLMPVPPAASPARVPPPRPAQPPSKPKQPPGPVAKAPRPAAPPPLAQPVAPPVPLAAPVNPAGPPSGSAFVFGSSPDLDDGASPRKGGSRRRRRRRFPIVPAIVGIVCVSLAVWGIGWMRYYMNKPDVVNEDAFAEQGNFRFKMPTDGAWKRDGELERIWAVNLALSHQNPRNEIALYYRDYHKRQPSEAELIDGALRKLRATFKSLEWELKPERNAKLGGKPALRLEFEGDGLDEVPMRGECYMMTSRGYAYWFFTWAPLVDNEKVRPEWATMRAQFSLLNNREGWTPRPRPSEIVLGKKVKYRLDPFEDVWKNEPLKDYDARADVVLLGNDPNEGAKHAGKAATLQVLVLPKADDLAAAVKAARDYLPEHFKDDPTGVSRTIRFATLKDKKGADIDRDMKIGVFAGHRTFLEVSTDDNWKRFVVLAVVNRPQGVLALVCDCDMKRRDYWEHEFLPLLDSLRLP